MHIWKTREYVCYIILQMGLFFVRNSFAKDLLPSGMPRFLCPLVIFQSSSKASAFCRIECASFVSWKFSRDFPMIVVIVFLLLNVHPYFLFQFIDSVNYQYTATNRRHALLLIITGMFLINHGIILFSNVHLSISLLNY